MGLVGRAIAKNRKVLKTIRKGKAVAKPAVVNNGTKKASGDGLYLKYDLQMFAEKSGINSADDIFTAGKNAFDNFDINNAYVKPKHLSTTGGNGQKFDGASKAEAESILKHVLSNGKIVSISDNGLTKAGNASYEIVIDAGKTIGTKGENLVKIVISSDGGMLSTYPIK